MRALVIPLLVVLLLLVACAGDVPPEQKVAALRAAHEITPMGYTTVTTPEGEPVLVVDVRVVNTARKTLPHLTVLVRVVGPDGSVKVEERHPLDLSDVQPGYGMQIAARIPGVAVEPTDQVQLELEGGLPPEEIRTLREYRDVVGE